MEQLEKQISLAYFSDPWKKEYSQTKIPTFLSKV